MNKKLTADIELKFITPEYATEVYELVNSNRNHLKEWLPWVDSTKSVESIHSYFSFIINKHKNNDGFGCLIFYKRKVVGLISLKTIDWTNKSTSIGYWIDKNHSGLGIITISCSELISYSFTELELNRIEICCSINNITSRKIPERLNFKLEGILEQAELINGKFRDMALYSILNKNWKNNSSLPPHN